MSYPTSPISHDSIPSDSGDDSSDDEPLVNKRLRKELESPQTPTGGLFDFLKSTPDTNVSNFTNNFIAEAFETANDNNLNGFTNEDVEDCTSVNLPTNSDLETFSEKSCDIAPGSAKPSKNTENICGVGPKFEKHEKDFEDVQKCVEQNSESQIDTALCSDKLERENTTLNSANSESVEEFSENSASRRSDRKAKSFARIRLVLAHEQIADDDNFLGFTNTRTYRPPKKKKVLCPFKAEKNYVKPKNVQKSAKVVQKNRIRENKCVPKETKTVTIESQTVSEVVKPAPKATKSQKPQKLKVTKPAQKVKKNLPLVTKSGQKQTASKRGKGSKIKTLRSNTDKTLCAKAITEQEPEPKVQSEVTPEVITTCSTDSVDQQSDIIKLKPKIKSELFSCQMCSYKTRNKYYIKRHKMTHDKPRISYECHYCDFVTRSLIRYKEHEALHTKAKPFKCLHCDYSSRSHTDFQRHQAKHSTEKKYKCPLCDFTTKWSRNVRHHILRHNTARPHKCHICGFSFKRMQDLKYHLYRHTDLKPISCDSCDFKCKTNYELRCHKLKHSDQRFYSCLFPGCTQQTKTKSDLTKHMNIHNTVKNFICDICQKAFNTKSCLAKHVRIHGEREPLRCDICQKLLKTRGSLHSHLKIHQGIYPFECDICLKKFSVKYNLIKHQETHMLNDRPYRCPICPHGARVMEHLLAHIGSMHGKSYAYFCEICRKPFKRYGQLKTHMGRMHSTSLDKTTVPAMQSMLKEMKTDAEVTPKLEMNDERLEFVQVKQEPVDHFPGDTTEVSLESIKTEPTEDLQPLSNPSGTTQDLVGNGLFLGSSSVSITDETSKSTINSDDKPLATVGIYNGVTLPLATKGFEFNLEKRGKKPKSWFMNPKNMDRKSADKHKKYLSRKERGLIPRKKAKLPTNKMERETERMKRRLQKYITSCSLSTKNETTLIFHTDRNQSDDETKNVKSTWLPRKNTVAALLLESKSTVVSDEPCQAPELTLDKNIGKKASKGAKRKVITRKKSNAKNTNVLKTTEKSKTSESVSTNSVDANKIIPLTIGEQQPDKTSGLGKEVKKKRGRPKGSKKNKPPAASSAITSVQLDTISNIPPFPAQMNEEEAHNPAEKTEACLAESLHVPRSPESMVEMSSLNEHISPLEVNPGEIYPVNEVANMKTKTTTGKKRCSKSIIGTPTEYTNNRLEVSEDQINPVHKTSMLKTKNPVHKTSTTKTMTITSPGLQKRCRKGIIEKLYTSTEKDINVLDAGQREIDAASQEAVDMKTKKRKFSTRKKICPKSQKGMQSVTELENGEINPVNPETSAMEKKVTVQKGIEERHVVTESTNNLAEISDTQINPANEMTMIGTCDSVKKKKLGRPKGSLNKKKADLSAIRQLEQSSSNSNSQNPSVLVSTSDCANLCTGSAENFDDVPEAVNMQTKKRKFATRKKISPKSKKGMQSVTENGNILTELNNGEINPVTPEISAKEKMVSAQKGIEEQHLVTESTDNLAEVSDAQINPANEMTMIETCDSVKKKKPGRPKGSLNKKKADLSAIRHLEQSSCNSNSQNSSVSVSTSDSANLCSGSADNFYDVPENKEKLKNCMNIKTEFTFVLRPCSVMLEKISTSKLLEVESFSQTSSESDHMLETSVVSSVIEDSLADGISNGKVEKMIPTSLVVPKKKKKKHDMSVASNGTQILFSELVQDSTALESDDKINLSKAKTQIKKKKSGTPKTSYKQAVSSELIQDLQTSSMVIEADERVIPLEVKKTTRRKKKCGSSKTSNEIKPNSSEHIPDLKTSCMVIETEETVSPSINISEELKTRNENEIVSLDLGNLESYTVSTETFVKTPSKKNPSSGKKRNLRTTQMSKKKHRASSIQDLQTCSTTIQPDHQLLLSQEQQSLCSKMSPEKSETSNENQIDSFMVCETQTNSESKETVGMLISSKQKTNRNIPKTSTKTKTVSPELIWDRVSIKSETSEIQSQNRCDMERSESSLKNQIVSLEIGDCVSTETVGVMVKSKVKKSRKKKRNGDIQKTSNESKAVSLQVFEDSLEIEPTNIMAPEHEFPDRNNSPCISESIIENQIISVELGDSQTYSLSTETIVEMLSSPVEEPPRKTGNLNKTKRSNKNQTIFSELVEDSVSIESDDRMTLSSLQQTTNRNSHNNSEPPSVSNRKNVKQSVRRRRKHETPKMSNDGITVCSEIIQNLETSFWDSGRESGLAESGGQLPTSLLLQSPSGNRNPDLIETFNQNQPVSSEIIGDLETDSVMLPVASGGEMTMFEEKQSLVKKRKPREIKRKRKKARVMFSNGEESKQKPVVEDFLANVTDEVEMEIEPENNGVSDNGFYDTITVNQEPCAQISDNNYLHDSFLNFNDDESMLNLSSSLDQDSSSDNTLIRSETQLPDYTF